MAAVMRQRARATAALWKWEINHSDLPSPEHHQALTLGVRFNDKGEMPRSYRTGIRKLAEDRKANTDTVNRDVGALHRKGWLFIEKGRGSRPSRYIATIPYGYTLRSKSEDGYKKKVGWGFVSPHPKVCVPSGWPWRPLGRGRIPTLPHIPHAQNPSEHTTGGRAEPTDPDTCEHVINDDGDCVRCDKLGVA